MMPRFPRNLYVALLLFCGVLLARADSQIVTWGATNSFGLGTIPPSLSNAVALAGGGGFSLGLKADGTVVIWGNPYYYPNLPVPRSATNVVAIAAALQTAIALRSDATVVNWGDTTVNVPAGLTNVGAIACGDSFNLALKNDGTVIAWGSAAAGSVTNVPAGLSNVVAIAASGTDAFAVTGDGNATAWGPGVPTIPAFTNLEAMAAGEFPVIGLKADGRIVITAGPPPPATLSNAVEVAASRYDGLALKADGTVTNLATTSPVPAGLTNVSQVACGQSHYLALIGDGAPFLTTPLLNRSVPPGSSAPFYALATGAWPLTYQWFHNGTNIPGATNLILSISNALPRDSGPYFVTVTNNFGAVTSAIAVLTVPDLSVALGTTDLVWTTSGPKPWFAETNITEDGVMAMQSGIVTNGQTSTLLTTVTGPGTLTFWWKTALGILTLVDGNTSLAQISGSVDWQQKTFYLGAGTHTLRWIFSNSGSPTNSAWLDQVSFVPGATAPVISVPPVNGSQAAGISAAFSATAVGTPPLGYQWFLNNNAITSATNASVTIGSVQPTNVGVYTLVVTNSAGSTNASANLSLGQVAYWNVNGPVLAPDGMTNIVSAVAGYLHTLALRSDGTLVAWGDDSAGESDIPPGLTNVISIAAGYNSSAALKADGTVTVWGSNEFGVTNVPNDLSNVVAIALAYYQVLALKADGSVVTWGYLGTNVPSTLSNVVAVAGTAFDNLALTADGTLVAWGQDNFGLLDFPPGVTNVVGMGGAYENTTAIRADGSIITWGDNSVGQTVIPTSLTNVLSVGKAYLHNLAITTDGTVAPADTTGTVPAVLTNGIMTSGGLLHTIVLLGNTPPLLTAIPSNATWSGNGFSFSLPSQSGRAYALEYKNSLTDTNWTALSLTAGTGGFITLTDATATNAQRFYRVRRW